MDETHGTIPLHIDATSPQCSTQELVELKLKENEQHTKIEFNDQSSNCHIYVYCCYLYSCMKAVSSLAYASYSCEMDREISSQKAVITNTHLIIKRDRIINECCCCCGKWSDNVESIPFEHIKDIHVNKSCVQTCHSMNVLEILCHNDKNYQAYQEKLSMQRILLVGVLHPHDLSHIILSRRDELKDKIQNKDDKPEAIYINTVGRILISMIFFIGMIVFIFIWYAYIYPVMPEINEMYTIWIDRILISFAIIHVLVAYVLITKYSITESKNKLTPRSTFPFKITKSKSAHNMYIFLLSVMLTFLLYRAVFMVYNEKHCHIHLTHVDTLHALIIITATTVIAWQSEWFHFGGWTIWKGLGIFCIVVLAVCVLFMVVIENIWDITWDHVILHNENHYCLHMYFSDITNITLTFLIIYHWLFHYLASLPYIQIMYATGIRKSQNMVFNHKLYKTLFIHQQYEILMIIFIFSLYFSLLIVQLYPWFTSIELIIVVWCICLMHPNHLWVYKLCCQCNYIICMKRTHRQHVNFDHLFEDEFSDQIELELATLQAKYEQKEQLSDDEYNDISKSRVKNNCMCSECKSIDRLIEAVNYYESLTNDKLSLIEYCHNSYTMLLDDYIHFVTNHNNETDLDFMFNKLITTKENDDVSTYCNQIHCSYLRRHHRQRRIGDNHTLEHDDELLFYIDLFDSIHCFAYHLYDKTPRIMRQQNDTNDYKEQYNSKDETSSNNKFLINVQEDDIQDLTMIDKLLIHLRKSREDTSYVENWWKTNEYDSDAIEYDINDDSKYNSNLWMHLQNENDSVHQLIKNYFYDVHLYENTFNIGYRFYFWPYYKGKTEITDDIEEWYWNKNDHNGYQLYQLYVEPKYSSIKEEVISSKIFAIELSQFNVSCTKTTKYMSTERVKTIKVRQIFGQNDPLRYGIKNGAAITYNHILCVILYCDQSELSREFSKTFRKTSPHQSITDIIERNSEYAIWARLLRETVEYFGHRGFGDVMEEKSFSANRIFKSHTINRLIGPFYCGLSVEIAMPEFSIRLSGPTSTSRQKQIALNFAGSAGLLIQLNNTGTEISGDLRGFDCCWISAFGQEDEVLFIGGEYRIRIQTVILIKTKSNYHLFFKSLFYFDCLLNGSHLNGYYITVISKKDYKILDELIKHKLKENDFENKCPKYINDTFESYANNKKEIILNLHEIDVNLSEISDLMLYPLKKTKIFNPTKWKKQTVYHDISGEKTNLFKPKLLRLFKNMKRIVIYSSQIEYVEYELDILQLFHSISSPRYNKIETQIKALHPSWISSKFSSSKCGNRYSSFPQHIISKFQENNFQIDFSIKRDIEGNKIDCLTIKRT
eukprot:94496_1